MSTNKEHIVELCDRIKAVYKPIFSRGFFLLSNADNEWNSFVQENQTHIEVRKNYFLPMLVLLVVVHLFSICLSAFIGGGDDTVGVFEKLCICFFKTIMVSLLCYTLTGILVKILFTMKQNIPALYFGEDFDLNKASVLMVFPYCLSMFSQILENLWGNFFFMHFITIILSFMIVWKGLVYVVPDYVKKYQSLHIWITILIGAIPLLLNKFCIAFFNNLMF